MIAESHYWKRELLRIASRLRRRISQRRWTGATFSAVEMDLMLGFYSIRRLAEAKKISDEIVNRTISLEAYPPTGELVHRRNAYKIDELFHLNSIQIVTRPLSFVSNQVIHSYIFDFSFDHEDWIDSVLFCSDRERTRFLFGMKIAVVASLYEDVGRNDPVSMQMTFNSKAADWDILVGPGLAEASGAQQYAPKDT